MKSLSQRIIDKFSNIQPETLILKFYELLKEEILLTAPNLNLLEHKSTPCINGLHANWDLLVIHQGRLLTVFSAVQLKEDFGQSDIKAAYNSFAGQSHDLKHSVRKKLINRKPLVVNSLFIPSTASLGQEIVIPEMYNLPIPPRSVTLQTYAEHFKSQYSYQLEMETPIVIWNEQGVVNIEDIMISIVNIKAYIQRHVLGSIRFKPEKSSANHLSVVK